MSISVSAHCDAGISSLPTVGSMPDADKAEFWAALAIRYCKGIGVRTHFRLLKRYGSSHLALTHCMDWGECGVSKEAISEIKSDKWRELARKEWDNARNFSVIVWNNEAYPDLLRSISDAPPFIYVKGNYALLKSPCVALVGSRKASPENRKVARILAQALSSCGITIVSGMAIGIDANAHTGALDEIGSSIGVLGTGIDQRYPSGNSDLYQRMEEHGLLVSEFAPCAPAKPGNFPVRNRIISGLSLGTVVVEAAARSGSLITAQFACDQNREVFAVPGAAFSGTSEGCQNLIRQGAHPVFSHEDILRELSHELRRYGDSFRQPSPDKPTEAKAKKGNLQQYDQCPSVPPENQTELPETVISKAGEEPAQRILACLGKKSMHIEALAQETGLEMNDLNSALIMLELTGQIRRLPGARFEI